MATEIDHMTSKPPSSDPGPIEAYASTLVRRAALLCVAARDMPDDDAAVLTGDLRTACETLLSSQALLLPNHRSREVPLSDVADWLASVAARVRADDIPDPLLDALAPLPPLDPAETFDG